MHPGKPTHHHQWNEPSRQKSQSTGRGGRRISWHCHEISSRISGRPDPASKFPSGSAVRIYVRIPWSLCDLALRRTARLEYGAKAEHRDLSACACELDHRHPTLCVPRDAVGNTLHFHLHKPWVALSPPRFLLSRREAARTLHKSRAPDRAFTRHHQRRYAITPTRKSAHVRLVAVAMMRDTAGYGAER